MPMGALYFDDRGIKRGLDVDLVEEVSRRTGCLIELRELSRVLQLRLLKSGQIAIGTAMAIDSVRARDHYVLPLMESRNEMLLARPALDHVQTPADLISVPGHVLGVVGGAVHGEPYDSLVESLRAQKRVVVAPDHGSNMQQLRQGRIQALIAHPFMHASSFIPAAELEQRFRILKWGKREDALKGGWALSRARFSPQQAERWREMFATMRTDGTLLRLLTRYVGQARAQEMLVR